MGLFDSVYARCPECGDEVEFQSKAGPCSLATYRMDSVPTAIAVDIDGDDEQCPCGTGVRLSTSLGERVAMHAHVPASDEYQRAARADGGARRVVCAAIRASDGEVLLGVRHYSPDMHSQIEARHDGHKFCHRHGLDQGFVDQHGVYLTREEAFAVAQADGQVRHPECCGRGPDGPTLYSEGLY